MLPSPAAAPPKARALRVQGTPGGVTGRLYAVLSRQFRHRGGQRDFHGHLLDGCTGEVLWSHLAHTERDMVTGLAALGDNRRALFDRYPGGYVVIYADQPGIIPRAVLAANRRRYVGA